MNNFFRMKTLLSVFVVPLLFCLFIGYANDAKALTYTITISNLQVVNFPNGDFDCPNDNGGCTMTIVIDIEDPYEQGTNYRITGGISSALKNKGTGNVNTSGANYTFPRGTVNILAGQFPGIPPMTINLTGVTTNSSGQFSFLVPM